jgi:cysteinyl-tRNA synthetase
MRVARSLLAAALVAAPALAIADDADAKTRLAQAKDWLYQLQQLDPEAVAASRFDVVVTDPSRDGTDADAWPKDAVAKLRTKGRVALAYVSIGEAESYRGYWRAAWAKTPPAWLGPENPDWKGNFAVRFWDPSWRAIVLADDGPLARALDAGFDGLYLDLVDVYERWAELGEVDEDEGARRMVAFVKEVATFARARKPGALVVPQNAASLVARPELLAVVDGIGLEDTFFDGERTQTAEHTTEVLAAARRIRAAGKPVFALDYCRTKAKVDRFYELALAQGFVPYATVRPLDAMTLDPGHEPR